MTQARSGAVRVAVGQLIWSSHAAPTPRPLAGALAAVSPTSGHAVQPPPCRRGRNGRPPGRRAAGASRGQGRHRPGKARQGRRAATGWLTCPPSARPASAARTPSARETSPTHYRTPPAPHPPARPGPAGHQTRPRYPARPAPGSTGSADDRAMDLTDECTCDAHHCDTSLTPKVARAPRPERTPPRALRPRRLIRLLRCRRRRPG